MKVLITGFDPFGGESINPAYEAVKLMPDTICGAEIIKLEIPTVYGKSGKVIDAKIEECNPDVVISIGQAGGRSSIAIEKVLISILTLYHNILANQAATLFILQKPESKIMMDSSQWIHH